MFFFSRFPRPSDSTRHSGDREHIALSISRSGDRAAVSVTDRGCGIPEDTLLQIRSGKDMPLDRRGDTSRGMGIGLSVCQSIIKAHGGTFAAGNNPEGGACFRFTLPMEEQCHE